MVVPIRLTITSASAVFRFNDHLINTARRSQLASLDFINQSIGHLEHGNWLMQHPGAQLSLSIVAAVERPIPMNVTDLT
jgi:hypothetical protein